MTPERVKELIEEAASESVDVERPLAAARMELRDEQTKEERQ